MKGPDSPGGEIAVLGLAKSGTAVARLLIERGQKVYASDGGSSPFVQANAQLLRDVANRVDPDSGAPVSALSIDTGGHDLARISRASMVVVSPGIDPVAAPIKAAREAGVRIVSEVEIALQHMTDTKVIAVTGTNGKTTTTALIGHILRGIGEDASDAGNIGTPVSEIALRPSHPSWIALEMSSFQLHDTPSLAPAVGVLTNLSPDHLDRYATADDYYADKARLFTNASLESCWVLNLDDRRVMAMAEGVPGKKYRFSTRAAADALIDAHSGMMRVLGKDLLQRAEFNLLGDHNVSNALAASLAVSVADPGFQTDDARQAMANALRSFRALAHRLEVVGELNGIQWINDSKATNVSSTLVAVAGMRRPTILLLGGRHKGEPYTSLSSPIQRTVKKVIAYGEAAPVIEADLGGITEVERLGFDFAEVMERARAIAAPGDAVLLSPACSSYDMFKNYEERGASFRKLAMGAA
ncbi:MAG TPA: UDP-N-acetylmuramoyl-L-alanine--D-glutamate ligase [Gemmatimonadaceae bacterium]|nr:UDP-N-acetylmuramoyl-L-alanine--D-glutamate ligase [Gemmatimonadaceae bacterium]